MANLVRLRGLSGLAGRVQCLAGRAPSLAGALAQTRSVATSKNQKSDKMPELEQHIEADPCKPKKTWVSYGYDESSEYADRHFMHALAFVTISLCFVTGGYIMAYMPDNRYKDWALREAYLELRRREDAGLPPIDINLIDPAKVKLPTDEELGDTDIII